jgi:hypothetical protein
MKRRPLLYVPAEVIGGRLVRICPECKQEIGERTDDEGLVSNHFAEHYEAEHPVVVEPERPRYYLLNSFKEGEVGRRLAADVLRIMRDRTKDADGKARIDWVLVNELEDLPEGESTLLASEIMRRLWDGENGDEGIPGLWHREGDKLVRTLVEETEEERERRVSDYMQKINALMDRHHDANAVLIARHEHRLPKFRSPKREHGDYDAVTARYDTWRKRREPLEAKITAKLDKAYKRSIKRLDNDRDDYREPLDEAIREADISDEEIDARHAKLEARLAEIRAG